MAKKWRIEVAHASGSYTCSSEHDRFMDAWRAWEDLDAYLTGGQRKRLLHKGRVIRRERAFPTPAAQPQPEHQEALWTA